MMRERFGTILSKMFGPIFGDPIKDLFRVSSPWKKCTSNRKVASSESMTILNFRAWHKISAYSKSLFAFSCSLLLKNSCPQKYVSNGFFASETFGVKKNIKIDKLISFPKSSTDDSHDSHDLMICWAPKLQL